MTTQAIGSTLKEARSRQSLTLEDVHAKIKIHPRVLQLLEEEKFEKLPSPVFARSFLKSYALFLNVDAEEVLRAYEQVERKEPEQSLFLKPPAMRDRSAAGFDRRLLVAPGLLVAALVAGFLLFQAAKGIGRAVSGWQKPAWLAAGPSKPSASKKKAAATRAAAQPASQKKAETDWLRSPDLGNFPAIPKKTPLDLKIKAVDNVWMRVTADGKVVFQSILKRGATQAWSAAEGFEIWTGNSSNMVLTLNGFNIGSPGRGVVKKLMISHQGVKIPGA